MQDKGGLGKLRARQGKGKGEPGEGEPDEGEPGKGK